MMPMQVKLADFKSLLVQICPENQLISAKTHSFASWHKLALSTSLLYLIDDSVPAEYASFPILEQLFTRISVDDGIEFNASAFSSEMREMAFILQNVSRASLVIVDELGRGTSSTDGLAISLAICGALIESRVALS
jgi:dsDNA-specific endonuclease/ATPase MutS2